MSFVRASLRTVVTQNAFVICGFISGVISARWLGPEGMGVLALLIAMRDLSFALANMGFGSAFAYSVARKHFSFFGMARLIWPIGVATCAIAISIFCIVWRTPLSPWIDLHFEIFVLGLCLMPPHFLNNYQQRVLSGAHCFIEVNISNLILGVCNVVGLVIAVIALRKSIHGAVWALLIAECAACAYLSMAIRKRRMSTENEHPLLLHLTASVPVLWRYGKWSYVTMLSNQLLSEAPRLLLKTLGGDNAAVGLFSIAKTLAQQYRIIATPISQVLFSYTASSEEREAVNRTNVLCRNMLAIMSVMTMIMAVVVRDLIYVLYGSAFMSSAEVFYAFAPSILALPFSQFIGVHLAAAGNPRIVAGASIAALLAGSIVCGVLIPRYQAVGAGAGVSVLFVVYATLLGAIYRRETGTPVREFVIPRKRDAIYYRKAFGAA